MLIKSIFEVAAIATTVAAAIGVTILSKAFNSNPNGESLPTDDLNHLHATPTPPQPTILRRYDPSSTPSKGLLKNTIFAQPQMRPSTEQELRLQKYLESSDKVAAANALWSVTDPSYKPKTTP